MFCDKQLKLSPHFTSSLILNILEFCVHTHYSWQNIILLQILDSNSYAFPECHQIHFLIYHFPYFCDCNVIA